MTSAEGDPAHSPQSALSGGPNEQQARSIDSQARSRPQAPGWVQSKAKQAVEGPGQHLVDHVQGSRGQLGRDGWGQLGVRGLDVAQQVHVVVAVEGGAPRDELEQDGAHAPQVRLGIVLLEAQDLGGHVQGRAAQRLRQALGLQGAGKAEVCNLQDRPRRLGGQQQVLGLEVPLRASAGSAVEGWRGGEQWGGALHGTVAAVCWLPHEDA